MINEIARYTLLVGERGKRLVLGKRKDAEHVEKLCGLDFKSDDSRSTFEFIAPFQRLVLV